MSFGSSVSVCIIHYGVVGFWDGLRAPWDGRRSLRGFAPFSRMLPEPAVRFERNLISSFRWFANHRNYTYTHKTYINTAHTKSSCTVAAKGITVGSRLPRPLEIEKQPMANTTKDKTTTMFFFCIDDSEIFLRIVSRARDESPCNHLIRNTRTHVWWVPKISYRITGRTSSSPVVVFCCLIRTGSQMNAKHITKLKTCKQIISNPFDGDDFLFCSCGSEAGKQRREVWTRWILMGLLSVAVLRKINPNRIISEYPRRFSSIAISRMYIEMKGICKRTNYRVFFSFVLWWHCIRRVTKSDGRMVEHKI